jgi:predicted ATPase/DNA-binding winged helix-turn-helix (wHTH) protein
MSTGTASAEAVADAAEDVLRFGPFTLCATRRVLLEGAARIPLGSRAFDILLLLLERAGTFVSKDEIVARVWPTTVVIEGNLRVHITALRKALSEGRDGRQYIVTVPNRGYSFVAPVSRGRAEIPRPPAEPPATARGLLAPLHRIVGRDAARDALGRLIRGNRLVTIVGAGGMGKTTLAIAIATRPEPAPWDAVRFVDLAPVTQGRMVADAVAAALELRVDGDAQANILAFLGDKSLLLLLDNCEHVLADAAELAEAILRAAPNVRLLATSREPLRAGGERIHQLQPLASPDAGERLSAAEAMRFGAIELFVDRATASLDTYAFGDADVDAVADVCRRLDGIPLAIELAAAFVSSLGVRGVRAALESRFLQAMAGRRTGNPRHRTLQAMVDWSYELLTPFQRRVLASLSLFSSAFTLESAGAIACGTSPTPPEVFDAVMELVAKSLLSVDVSGDPTYFRLLETTRSYASVRLLECGDLPALRRRHARHTLDLLRESEQAWRDADAGTWRLRYGRHVDDVRSALAWAMSAEGDVELGIALTVHSVQLLSMMSRTDESMRLTSAAMDALAKAGTVDPVLRFELHLAHALMLIHARREMPAMQQALERAGEIARAQGDRRLLLDAIGVNWFSAYVRSDTRVMREMVQQFESLTAADGDPDDRNLSDRRKAQTLHLIGDQRGARLHAERALAPARVARPPFLGGTLIDRGITMEALLARILWLQGLPDQAERAATRALELARQDGGSMTTTMVMGLAACPLAMWTGRLDLARQRVALFSRLAREHSLGLWRLYALAFEALLDWHDGGRQGEPVLPDRLQIRAASLQLGELVATLHAGWADDSDFRRGDSDDAGWAQPELLRVRAGRALAAGHAAEAEALLQQSLARARQDGTLSWELRTTTSLARLRMQQGRPAEAVEALGAVLCQFTEGHDTADVREAVALRDALALQSAAAAT